MSDQNTTTAHDEMFFITVKTSHDIRDSELLADIFDQREYSDIIVRTLIYLVDRFKLKLQGFLILSDQIHLIFGASDEDLYEKIEILKRISAREIIVLIGKKLRKMDDDKSRKHAGLRKVFGSYLNQDESIFWEKTKKLLKLHKHQNQREIKPITSAALIAHLRDENRNYLQLGADAFTKLMLTAI